MNEHLHNMVDASDTYVLMVYPFGRNDKHQDDYDTETWETELYGGCPAMKRVSDGRVMAVREDKTSFRISKEWVVS